MVIETDPGMVTMGFQGLIQSNYLLWETGGRDSPTHLLRKEVIHPHLPVRIPCYDLVLIANLAVEGPLNKVTVTRFGRY